MLSSSGEKMLSFSGEKILSFSVPRGAFQGDLQLFGSKKDKNTEGDQHCLYSL